MGDKRDNYKIGLLLPKDKRLFKKSDDIDENDDNEVSKYVNFLLDKFSKSFRMQGFSLPQFGISKRAILVRPRGKKLLVMINPVIEKTVGKWLSTEGCPSVGKLLRYRLSRPIFTKVSYYDFEQKKRVSKWFARKYSRVICHEVDHLNGILINKFGVDVSYMYKRVLYKKDWD